MCSKILSPIVSPIILEFEAIKAGMNKAAESDDYLDLLVKNRPTTKPSM